MKESEAIELFKERLVFIKEHYSEEVKCYEEALEIGIQALEKQIPKKPRNERRSVPMSSTSVRFVNWYKCGKCNSDLSRQFVCCPYCQGVIDWGDESEID